MMNKRKSQADVGVSNKRKPRHCSTLKRDSIIGKDAGCSCTSSCHSQIHPSREHEPNKRRQATGDLRLADNDAQLDCLMLAANGDRQILAKQLLDRAQAYFKKGCIGKAFEDALGVTRVIPNHPIGYAVTGHFYSVLGRRLDAIDSYCCGLAQVPHREPGYDGLVIALAEQMSELRKIKTRTDADHIAKLPMDLLVSIFQMLSLEERIAWTRASSSCREGLFQCGTLWTSFAMDNTDPRWDIFSAVYMHIKNLTIGAFRRVPAIRLFNKMDMKATFKHLRSLRILGCSAPKELICIGLSHMRQLTEFSITSPNVSIDEILSSCSTLKALSFIESSNTPKAELCSHANLPDLLPLESLTVIYPQMSRILFLAPVLRRCHVLRNFFSNSDIRDILEEPYCRHLNQLYVLVYLSDISMEVTIRESCRDISSVMPTEDEFSNYTDALARHLDDLYQSLPVARTGTESLVFDQRCCAREPKGLVIADTFFNKLEFDQLYTVDYIAPFAEEHRCFAAFIQRQPMLSSLRSVNGNILTDYTVISSLSASAYLKKIMLEEAYIGEEAFTAYTRHQESLDSKSPLQYLVFYGVHGINDAVIQAIAALPHLRGFTLQAQNAAFTTRGLIEFADTLASSHHFERLILYNVTSLDDDTVAKLANVRPLRGLIICNPGASLTAEGVMRLAMNSRNLNEIRLVHCPGVTISNPLELKKLYNVDVSVHI